MATSRRAMTKSVLSLCRAALQAAEGALPIYAHRFAPKKFTQHQMFAILAVQQFLDLDYRGVVQLVREWSDLREVLGLDRVPTHNALWYAAQRLLKKKGSKDSWMKPFVKLASAA